MRIEVLGCFGGQSTDCRATTLLVGDSLAVDAGCLGQALSLERQAAVRTVLLTHSHLDHVASLPFFLENVRQTESPVTVCGHPETLAAVREHLFNDVLWPNFGSGGRDGPPQIELRELEAEVPIEMGTVTVMPIRVSHPVPTFALLLEEGDRRVLWSSDTGPTERLWEVANARPSLDAVFLEVSFCDAMSEVARQSQHLTPATMKGELEKLRHDCPVLAHHLKPICLQAIREELRGLADHRVKLLEQGGVYRFGAAAGSGMSGRAAGPA